jgi:hypothetical protein
VVAIIGMPNSAAMAAARSVGYSREIKDLESFIDRLVKLLRDPDTFANGNRAAA